MLDDRKWTNRLAARSPLAHPAPTDDGARAKSSAGLIVTLLDNIGIVGISARAGRGDKLAAQVRERFGIDLPAGPACVTSGATTCIGIGPGQWLVAIDGASDRDALDDLASALGDCAVLVDQSDAKCILRLTGADTRAVLAQGLTLDLHPRAFQPGCAAQSVIAHIGVLIWQTDNAPTYHIAVPRSYMESFWHWLVDAAAPHGMALDDRG